jgi:hypothetical protein
VIQIDESLALEGQFLLATERANMLKDELFGVVARLKPNPTEFSHPLDQRLH